MSTFEKQVAEALLAGLVRDQGEMSPDPEHWDSVGAGYTADNLAPRVVAALEAAWRFNPYPRNTHFVLQALRGVSAPSKEEPQ